MVEFICIHIFPTFIHIKTDKNQHYSANMVLRNHEYQQISMYIWAISILKYSADSLFLFTPTLLCLNKHEQRSVCARNKLNH